MKRLENWMIINLSKPTIIADIYGDYGEFKKPNGYQVQIEIKDIDIKNFYLFSRDEVYKLGEIDPIWWKTKKGELRF